MKQHINHSKPQQTAEAKAGSHTKVSALLTK